MKLDEVLDQIAEVRSQLSHAETYRGFRSRTVACFGLLGCAVAGLQAKSIPEPLEQVTAYVALCTVVAMLCVGLIGLDLALRWAASASLLRRRLILLAVQQFVLCLFVGAIITAVIVRPAPRAAGMLPGL